MRTPHGHPPATFAAPQIRLVDVYQGSSVYEQTLEYLYLLLAERPPEANISHRQMPTMEQHRQFVDRRPYEAWYLIESTSTKDLVGSVYLTHAREVGIFIKAGHQGEGYGVAAVKELIRQHPGKLLANVAPSNQRSIEFFKRMGWKQIQVTFEIS